MKKIIVTKDGKVTFDGKEITKKDINSDFLDDLFMRSLKSEVEFDIDDTDPISKLFAMIRDETKSGSEFYVQFESLKKSYEKIITEKTAIEQADSEEKLSF
ncbi:MAG: hypothetical protein PHF05_06875 [Candidatus Izemoplasmatales bacterium]|nr:hypothetical protein [Candidatus Izemoplasmatales bacterium]MDD4070158.1 hypothetical protein [Candidatus Izemoplasmatales bacterium]